MAVRSKPRLFAQAKLCDVGFKNLFHLSSPDDKKARAGKLAMNFCRRLQEFALAFAARQGVATHDCKREVARVQPPGCPLGSGFPWLEALHVEAAIDDVDFGVLAGHRRAVVP